MGAWGGAGFRSIQAGIGKERSMRLRYTTVAMAAALFLGVTGVSAAAVTPGWECVPTTAGQAVTSGGTGSSPSCATGTPVLAPTYVAAGVGGQPTVEFSAVNVQIVSGAGTTASVNAKGNLVVGYNETPGTQTGSHNLILGTDQSYTRYGSILGGTNNTASGPFTTVLGNQNTARGPYATVAGGQLGTATASYSAITGGYSNRTTAVNSSVNGGCFNLAGPGSLGSVPSECSTGLYYSEIAGGQGNQVAANSASVSGGQLNLANAKLSTIAGGCHNVTGTGPFLAGVCSTAGLQTVAGGSDGSATGATSTISGGHFNTASGLDSSVSGGGGNVASGNEASVSGGNANTASGLQSSATGGVLNIALGVESSVTGGFQNVAKKNASSIAGGENNTAGDPLSFIGAGCDNLTGPGAANTEPCDPGGEAILGGAGVTNSTKDGTSP
jgi:hypothetical protein